jgi:hypothetical protein
MPSRFTSGAYEPEIVKLMSEAFDSAWARFTPRPSNEDLAKKLLAGAVIELVEGGVRDPEALVRRASMALQAAIKIDPALLNLKPESLTSEKQRDDTKGTGARK